MSRNYKDTLNLPKTDFPMKAGLTTREPEILERWQKEGLYQRIQQTRSGAELFVLHDGPPFANGDVHMGTALNKILKDLVVKSKTMLGYRAPYVPGWDCPWAPDRIQSGQGIARPLPSRSSETFRGIRAQIRRYPANAVQTPWGDRDWDHPYLTLDPAYEAEILRAFAVLVSTISFTNRKSRSSGALALKPPSPSPKSNTPTARIRRSM
jgi:isoleucyl-tRNA synthetase